MKAVTHEKLARKDCRQRAALQDLLRVLQAPLVGARARARAAAAAGASVRMLVCLRVRACVRVTVRVRVRLVGI